MSTYSVMVVGMGKRGNHHATHFHANDNFEVVGICDIDEDRLAAAAPDLGNPRTGSDAAAMAAELKPDVFCFCTMPNLRLDMIKIGIENGAKLIAFEKPIALNSEEAAAIKEALAASDSKAVVSHQHRYGAHYQKVKEIIASGALGRVHTVYGTSTGWMAHMMTHLIDYTRWFNDNADAEWVMAQAAGKGKFADAHVSPDYIAGLIQFDNGVRGIVECGAGAPDVPEVDYWWRKARIGAQGTEGFAEVLTGGGWRAVTKDGLQSGEGCMNYDLDMPGYIQDMADWLNDGTVHPCNFDSAYAGFQIFCAMIRSVIEGGQVALPIQPGGDSMEELKAAMPDKKVLLSMPENADEYGD
ncbi:MAG: Gfo/Idh/MocA family oxidoreductase [Candidatus Pacebacteria bacterium]|nr:Gfo/Idh/MocA family oxidoreductase [Candidatus Paceibacterota bacterium]